MTKNRNALVAVPLSTSEVQSTNELSERRSKAYRKLFESVETRELTILTQDPDVSLALQARWEMSRKLIKRHPTIPHQPDWIYDPAEIKQFITFFATCVGFNPPQWWVNTLLSVDSSPREANARYAQSGIKRTATGKKATLSDGIRKIVVPTRYLCSDYVIFKLGCAYVANYHTMISCPFTLVCYSVETGKALWTRMVWGNNSGDFSGYSIHQVSLALERDQVVVYGSQGGNYSESFRQSDGQPIFKFSPTYWGNSPETWKVPRNKSH